jgi:tetratricopeptide (TPR) repeat protein
MLGDVEGARLAYARAAEVFDELGLELARAALTQIGVPLELSAGDAVAAEQEARKGADILARFGSAMVQAPLIGEALHAQGRFEEAADALAGATLDSGPRIAQWQVRLRIVEARLAVVLDGPGDAVEIAQAGVALADRTEDINLRGDALATLAGALVAGGRGDEAAEATDAARAHYEAKENLAAAATLAASVREPA